jgi:Tol biopolymer transport system component/DNA-binding winged helix-turn-helix (wHTH) protein
MSEGRQMAEAPSTPRLLRFGVFELDQRTGELRKAGAKLGLQDQPLQVLTMLLERPGELVTREQLKERLWPDHTFVDFEQGLNAAVKRLRTTLGDSADTPRFVETLPRRGYRFIGSVENGTHPRPTAPRPPRRRLLIVAAIGLLIVAVAVIVLIKKAGTPSSSEGLRALPLTSLAGWEMDPAVSPDGNQVAFLWNGGHEGDPLHLYVKAMDAANALKLSDGGGLVRTGAWSASTPAWSPDGTHIAFVSRGSGPGGDILVVSPLGGTPRRLGTTAARFSSLSWSPDGRHLATVDRAADGGPDFIALMSVVDGQKRRMTSPGPAYEADTEPRISPDGRQIAFIRRVIIGAVAELFVMPIAGGELTRLTFDNTNVLGVDWTPDGRELVFSSTRTGSQGRYSLWRLPVGGGQPRRVEIAGDLAITPSIARRGNRMVYVRWQRDWDIWRAAGPAAGTAKPPASPFITSTRWDFKPEYSPDGLMVSFVSLRSGAQELWVCRSDGSGLTQLTFLDSPRGYGGAWSPDGRLLTFVSNVSGNFELYVVPAAGGFPTRLTNDPFQKGYPNWSRDGRWIYFSMRRNGSEEVWKVAASGGEPVEVTRNGGTKAVESSDGRSLYFTKSLPLGRARPGIWRMPLAGGAEERVVDQGEGDGWAMFEQQLCYFETRFGSHPRRIDCLDVARGKVRTLVELDVTPMPLGMSISPDGRSVLFVVQTLDERDLIRIENFR